MSRQFTPAEVRAATLEAFLAALDEWLANPLASYSPEALRAEVHRRIRRILAEGEEGLPPPPTLAEQIDREFR